MNTPNEGGVGGGSVAGFCSPNPADQAGTVENILSRLEELETAVSQLLGANTAANQLSELSENAGWIYNVTYLGQPGWTQTPSGTLIPPIGVSLSSLGLLMSDGTPFGFMGTDSDGNPSFGIQSDGQSTGSGGDPAHYYYRIGATPVESGVNEITNNFPTFITDGHGALTVDCPTRGIYLVTAEITWDCGGCTLAANTLFEANIEIDGSVYGSHWRLPQDINSVAGQHWATGTASLGTAISSDVFFLTAGQNIGVSAYGTFFPPANEPATFEISGGRISVVRLGNW